MPTPPYARQKGPGRPPNAWIIYRKTMLPTLPPVPPGQPRRCQAEVSRIISKMWREEPDHVKAEYERMAEQEKALHLQLNPGYKFSPVSKAEKDKLKAAEAAQKELDRSNSKKGRNRGGPYMVPILAAPSSAHVLPAYYDPARLFGHAGPSPHMSGASSPTSTKSAPLHLPRSDQASQSHPTRSSSHSSPIAETYQNQQNYRPSSAPVTYLTPMPPPQTRQVHPPLPNPDLYQPQLHSQPQQHETFAVDLTPWNHNPTYDGQVTMHGVSAEGYASYQSMVWNGQQNVDIHNAAAFSRDDPSHYSVGDLNLDTFVNEPGEIEVSMGIQQMPYSLDLQSAPYAQFANLFSTFDYADLGNASLSQTTDNTNMDPSQIVAPPSFFNNPPETPTSRSSSSSAAPQQIAPSPITPQSFFNNGVESSLTSSTGSSYAVPQQQQQQQQVHPSYGQDVFQQYINFDALSPPDNITPPRPAPASRSQTMPAENHNSQRTSPPQAPYAPPSAASHVGTRRVGGSWRPRPESDSPLEQSPTGLWAYPVST